MHLVLGLGNPGPKYDGTRHNAGFLVADRLAERWGSSFDGTQGDALVSKPKVAGVPALLAKPQSYMNHSGYSASMLRSYYKVPTDHMVVVHDDVDIGFGQIRVKNGGGHGGHNGLRNIVQQLGEGGFVRVRFGVSRPPPRWDTADYVLSRWTVEESDALDGLVDRAADAVETVIKDGVKAAMNHFNTRPRARSEKPPVEAEGGPKPRTEE